MFVRLCTITLLASLCASGPVLADEGGMVSEQAAREAADAAAKQFESAYNAGNAAGIAALFAKDGVYLTPVGTMLSDPQDIQKAIGGRMKAGWTKEVVKVVDAHPAGEGVWAIGQYSITGTGASSGKEIGGYYAVVMRREGSDWRYQLLIGNLKPEHDVSGMAAPR
ncbi:MAG TPA: nuclear transport factor 2 family protein [Rhodopila sp.]|jgi:ketosteroid isomerase-like protein|nr:nuclear transport factor 2 family protein [Rhodopila sp.]